MKRKYINDKVKSEPKNTFTIVVYSNLSDESANYSKLIPIKPINNSESLNVSLKNYRLQRIALLNLNPPVLGRISKSARLIEEVIKLIKRVNLIERAIGEAVRAVLLAAICPDIEFN